MCTAPLYFPLNPPPNIAPGSSCSIAASGVGRRGAHGEETASPVFGVVEEEGAPVPPCAQSCTRRSAIWFSSTRLDAQTTAARLRHSCCDVTTSSSAASFFMLSPVAQVMGLLLSLGCKMICNYKFERCKLLYFSMIDETTSSMRNKTHHLPTRSRALAPTESGPFPTLPNSLLWDPPLR